MSLAGGLEPPTGAGRRVDGVAGREPRTRAPSLPERPRTSPQNPSSRKARPSRWRTRSQLSRSDGLGPAKTSRLSGTRLQPARTDPGVVVERADPDAERLGMAVVRAEPRRTAFAAEPGLASAVRGFHIRSV